MGLRIGSRRGMTCLGSCSLNTLQIPRPWVTATTSWPTIFSLRMEAAGNPSVLYSQLCPPLYDMINPMSVYAAYYRNIFYYVKYPDGAGFPTLIETSTALGITFLLFFLGYYVFKRLEPRFAEEI